MAFSRRFIERIKFVHAAEIIKSFVKLEPYAKTMRLRYPTFIGICPWHNDVTPSFHVGNDRYKCYGCGKSGSVIDFLMNVPGHQMSFEKAVAYIASHRKILLPKRKKSRLSKKQRAFDKWLDKKLDGLYWSSKKHVYDLSPRSQKRWWRAYRNYLIRNGKYDADLPF